MLTAREVEEKKEVLLSDPEIQCSVTNVFVLKTFVTESYISTAPASLWDNTLTLLSPVTHPLNEIVIISVLLSLLEESVTQHLVMFKQILFFCLFFSLWEQGQDCDSDGVRQPGGSVRLHLWQEEALRARSQALLQANRICCALLPSSKNDYPLSSSTFGECGIYFRCFFFRSTCADSLKGVLHFTGQYHLQSYIMGIIYCHRAALNRKAVRTMQREAGRASVRAKGQLWHFTHTQSNSLMRVWMNTTAPRQNTQELVFSVVQSRMTFRARYILLRFGQQGRIYCVNCSVVDCVSHLLYFTFMGFSYLVKYLIFHAYITWKVIYNRFII